MGGKEALRGFLYQGFASVLEALCHEDWDRIYIELDSKNDKVDIALEANHIIVKSIQVKSTTNVFKKNAVKEWLIDLIHDNVGASSFELYLIGQCDEAARTFINSIDKLQHGQLDTKARDSLEGFDVNIVKGREITFSHLPCDTEALQRMVISSLFQYISLRHYASSYEQVRFIALAMESDQLISSTHRNGVSRKKFDEELDKRVTLLADQYSPERISIGIESFPPSEIKSEEEAEICLSLTDHFKDRKLKEHLDWNRDIYEKLESFLRTNTDKKHAYQLCWSTHCSIAFAAGRILNSKEGINIFPVQKTATHGTELWDVKLSPGREYPKWKISDSGPVENKYDTALILNVTRNIHDDVISYVEESHIPVGRLIDCTLEENSATNFSVQDGTHASLLANSIYDAIGGRNLAERRAVLHIFAAAPNALMFFLGQNSMGFGKCILYEYDFEKRRSCTYSPSFDFTN